MPYILDTDIVSIWQQRTPPDYERVRVHMARHSPQEIFIIIVSFQEVVKGWLAALNKPRSESQLLWAYTTLHTSLWEFCRCQILPFDQAVLDRLSDLRRQKVQVGTMDLRVASIALATGSTVATRNVGDFKKVPGLAVEDWTQ